MRANLLVIDDNLHNRDILSRYLQKSGYDVMTASNGSEGLELIECRDVDLVLLDVVMPGMHGYEVLDIIRQNYSAVKLPVIMITSLTAQDEIVNALNRGANDYITKPFEPKVANARIMTHLRVKQMAAERDWLMDITSHDIKKPVILMDNIIETILEDHADLLQKDESLQEAMQLLHDTATRLYRFVNDFLDMRILEEGQLILNRDAVDLNQLISEAVKKLQPLASAKQIGLRMELDQSMADIMLDEDRIIQVIENLVSNAIKYSEPGKQIVIASKQEAERIICHVIDQGPGIRDDEISGLFRRFFRTSNRPTANESSTGLGLSICRDLIRLHQGDIGVYNNERQGACFWFALPSSA